MLPKKIAPTPDVNYRKLFPQQPKILRPARKICGVGLGLSHRHSSRSGRLQRDPVVKSRVSVAGARPRGVLMWTTLFGIAFVISFSALFAAIAMDF